MVVLVVMVLIIEKLEAGEIGKIYTCSKMCLTETKT